MPRTEDIIIASAPSYNNLSAISGSDKVTVVKTTTGENAYATVSALSLVTVQNASFSLITGSSSAQWNDASASNAGVSVGGLYHSSGSVKVRLS